MKRAWLAALAALGLAAAPADAQRACPPERVTEAFHFAFPVYQMMRTRQEATRRVAAAGRNVVNAFNHRTTLSDHSHRNVTTPNNDTLYSAAWIDLAAGPVTLRLPPPSGRYVSVALMDLFTDHFAVLHPEAAQRVLLVGPQWRGRAPGGVRLLRSPTNDVWAIGRTFVTGAADLDAARAVQSQIAIERPAPPARPFLPEVPPLGDSAAFLGVVNAALARGPLPPVHARRVARFRCTGLVPGGGSSISPAVRRQWEPSLTPLYDRLRGGLQQVGPEHQGWSYPAAGIGRFGTDDLYRSRVALEGLAALPEEEAIYLSARADAAGRPLHGERRYRLRIPPRVPVAAFWSLSMYEIAPDGRLFFTENPLNRFAIGSRTEGLRREPDGSTVILLQNEAPPPGERGNWLPAPRAPFALTFRAYRPLPAMRRGVFRLPAVERLR